MAEENDTTILSLTAEIVASHISHNRVGTGELPTLITNVHAALAGLGSSTEETVAAPELKPAVSVRNSVKPDHIVCLEDGKKLTMLKRYLQTRYGMTPADYRAKWNLPADYPMVAPNYAERRRELAKEIGLGRKPASDRKPRGRKTAQP